MKNFIDITNYLDQPKKLEELYREDSKRFEETFNSIYTNIEHTDIVQVWYERLNYRAQSNNQLFRTMMIIALLSSIFSRIVYYFIEQNQLLPINLLIVILTFIGFYFYHHKRLSTRSFGLSILFLVLMTIWINFMSHSMNDTTVLMYLHTPVLMWLWIGFIFSGKEDSFRIDFIRMTGEFIVLYTIMAISGIILTVITLMLFDLMNVNIFNFYFSNIVIIGISSLSIVSTYLIDMNTHIVKQIAPLIAKLFGPLVFITLSIFLLMSLFSGSNPFMNRDFLLIFNLILILVLAIIAFSIIENSNKNKNLIDYSNFALIVLALVIDALALSSIIGRLSQYGLTPNRISVLGINLLIGIHLIIISINYFKFMLSKKTKTDIILSITQYLPVYGIWCVIVIGLFPILFN